MNIENDIFKRTKLNIDFLIPYGFTKNNNVYEYSKKFMDTFRADIVIDEQGKVNGNVYVGDAWNCFEGTIDKNKNLELAEDYWKYEKNNIGKELIVEVLVNGKIKVIEIVKENKAIKQAE